MDTEQPETHRLFHYSASMPAPSHLLTKIATQVMLHKKSPAQEFMQTIVAKWLKME
jgi:hypothetical protein